MTILDFINLTHRRNRTDKRVTDIVSFLKEKGALTFEELQRPPPEEPSPPPSPVNSMPPTPQPNGRTIKNNGIAGVGSRRVRVNLTKRRGGRSRRSRRSRRR